MNITDPRFKYVNAAATDIRKAWQQVDAADDWRCRIEGAREVMRKLTPPANVTQLQARRAK